ncbi:unnamed protein product, partial [Meganyctiphanes norvegica]
RFLATLYPMQFKESQKYQVFRYRMLGLVLLSTLIHLPFITFGTVDIVHEDGDQQDNVVKNISFYRDNSQILVVHDGYHSINSTWYYVVLLTTREIIDVWVPMTLLLLLNMAQVCTMMCTKQTFSRIACERVRRRKVCVNITLMVKAGLFFTFSIPISIYDYVLAERYDNVCHGSHSVELFRGIAKSLKLCQHVIHIFFLLALNVTFKKELSMLSHSIHGNNNQREVYDSTLQHLSGGINNKSNDAGQINLI